MSKRVRFSSSLPQAFLERLEALAKENVRPLSHELEYQLTKSGLMDGVDVGVKPVRKNPIEQPYIPTPVRAADSSRPRIIDVVEDEESITPPSLNTAPKSVKADDAEKFKDYSPRGSVRIDADTGEVFIDDEELPID